MDADLFAPDSDPAPARSPSWWRRGVTWARRPVNDLRPHVQQWLGSLKLRLAAGALLALWAGMALVAWQMVERAEHYTVAQAAMREHATAQRTAELIGRRLAELQRALRLVGAGLNESMLQQPFALAGNLDQQLLLRALFADVFVADAEGGVRVLADAITVTEPRLSVADRAYFRRLLAEGRGQISEPLPSLRNGEPVVVLAEPLWSQGPGSRLIGVIGGTVHLASHELLLDDSEARAEEGHAVTVVTDRQGTVIAHAHRAMLMRPLPEDPRLGEAAVRWVEQERPEGSPLSDWRQPGQVVAMATEPLAGWHVWRAVAEPMLLAPVRAARSTALRDASVAALGMTALLVMFMAWQLRPLAQVRRRAAALLRGGDDSDQGWPEVGGEIGELARTLRHVWAERQQMEGFNSEVLGKLRSVMAAAPVGLAFTRHGRFELVSAECCRVLGRTEGDLIGQPTQMIFAANTDFQRLGPAVGACFERGEAYAGEWQLLRADGSVFWARLRARAVVPGHTDAGTIWSLYDISDQVRARDALERAALEDALTGVANRAGFERQLQSVFDRTAGPGARPAAVVMIDLDHFKPINDNAGHAAGDAMLAAVAQAISAQVRESDVVARLGGDEFALLLPGCGANQALRIAEKVRVAVVEFALHWDGQVLQVGASLGVAVREPGHSQPADWLAAADAALYEAKRAGRNRVRGCGRLGGTEPRAAVVRLHAR
jgi:diguanylate cyclase